MLAGTGPGDGTEIRVFQEEEIAMVSKMERNIGENVNVRPAGHQDQVIKACPLHGSHKN